MDALAQQQKDARQQATENPWLTACSHFKGAQALTEEMAHALIERVEIDGENHVFVTLRYRDAYHALLQLLAVDREAIAE